MESQLLGLQCTHLCWFVLRKGLVTVTAHVWFQPELEQTMPFLLQASSSASLISCTSPKCSCGSPHCGCAAQQCTYTRSYAEQSSSSGVLLEDVLALHDGESMPRLSPLVWS